MNIDFRLKASTLMESLVAMVLIMLTMCIGGMIYANVLSSSDNARKLNAQLLLDQVVQEMKEKEDFIDGSVEVGEIRVEKRVQLYKETDGLWQVSLKAYDAKNKLLATQIQLLQFPGK